MNTTSFGTSWDSNLAFSSVSGFCNTLGPGPMASVRADRALERYEGQADLGGEGLCAVVARAA